MHNNTELCSLIDEESIESFLKNNFNISKQKIKKSSLSKKALERKVSKGDVIHLPFDLLNPLQINPLYNGEELKELSNDNQNLVLSKPSYCHIHPLSYNDTNNVLSYVRNFSDTSYLKINKESYDRSLLYRIDYETSGLVILTKEYTREEVVIKNYLAVVEGQFKADEIELNDLLTTSGKKVKVSDSGEASVCEVHKLGYCEKEDKTLVSVFLKEGRRHQIRVQLANYGHPIVGDTLYGGKEEKRFFGLHAFSYIVGNNHYTDENIPFRSLFSNFLDLNSYFKMFSDKFRVS